MRLLSLVTILLISLLTRGQDLTGSWYGKANVMLTGSNNNYLTEMIIKQKGDEIEGIFGYYFRNGYKSLFIRGTYDKKNRQIIIKKFPLTYFRASSIDGVECIMDFYGTVVSSRKETTIKGVFISDPRYIHTCPEVTLNYTLDINEANQDSLITNRIAQKIWAPRPEDIVVNDAVKDTAKTAVLPAGSAAPDTVSKRNFAMDRLVEAFNKRKNVYSKEIEINSDSVRVSFYDNGDIDGDSISVFLNKIPVVTKQALTAQALNIYLKLDPSKEVNELSMFAENLGKFPPNTALMVIYDGEKRYEVYLSSSLTQNSSVRLRRKK
ncbi:MAG: hypothetical protein ABI151_18795 [Chitinophagaceae bacterium]